LVWFGLGRVENPLNSCALFIQTIQVYQLEFVLQTGSLQDRAGHGSETKKITKIVYFYQDPLYNKILSLFRLFLQFTLLDIKKGKKLAIFIKRLFELFQN